VKYRQHVAHICNIPLHTLGSSERYWVVILLHYIMHYISNELLVTVNNASYI